MNEEKKRNFQERMAALHEKFCRQLPEKYTEIENHWKEYQSDFNNDDFFESFYRHIHTLKGTAATFGFNKQADICFEIQKLLNSIKEDGVSAESSQAQVQEYLDQLKRHINSPADNKNSD